MTKAKQKPRAVTLDGKAITPVEIAELSPVEAARVEVTLASGEVVRPWRFTSEIAVRDGVLVI